MPLRLAHMWWSIGALLVVVDIGLSLAPPGDGPPLLPDKLVHFTTYLVLAGWFTSLAPNHPYAALIGVIALGGLLELLQGLTSYRQTEWLDFLANTSGALLAFLVVRILPFNLFASFEKRLPMLRR